MLMFTLYGCGNSILLLQRMGQIVQVSFNCEYVGADTNNK